MYSADRQDSIELMARNWCRAELAQFYNSEAFSGSLCIGHFLQGEGAGWCLLQNYMYIDVAMSLLENSIFYEFPGVDAAESPRLLAPCDG